MWVVTVCAIREKLAVGGVDAEALVCLLFVVRGRLGGASPSPKAGGERRLRGDPDSEVEESMSDPGSTGMSVRAALALGVGLP